MIFEVSFHSKSLPLCLINLGFPLVRSLESCPNSGDAMIALQASLSFTGSPVSLFKLLSIESVMLFSHLIPPYNSPGGTGFH